MTDLIYAGLTLLFLGLSWLFVVVCDRLMEDRK